MLAQMKIATPCEANWSAMCGTDRARFCRQCEKNVYDLSAMTAEEAEALLVEKEGRVCVRYYERADGTVMTSDCRVGVRKKWRRRAAKALTAAPIAIAIATPIWRVVTTPKMGIPHAKMLWYERNDYEDHVDVDEGLVARVRAGASAESDR